jgi:hypothetical protein
MSPTDATIDVRLGRLSERVTAHLDMASAGYASQVIADVLPA